MKEFWTWASNKLSAVTSGIQTSYEYASGFVGNHISQPLITRLSNQITGETWEGFTRVFDPSNLTAIFQSRRTRSSIAEAFKVNAIYYLGLVMMYQTTSNAIYNQFTDNEDSAFEYTIYTMNAFANVAFGVLMLHRYYDNTMINLALSKQVTEENPISKDCKPCGCDSGALIQAGLFSSINLTGKLASIWMASYLPVVKFIAPVAYTYAYGESLAEYSYSAVGMCTKHRAEILSKHKAYSLGLGASLYGVGEALTALIEWQTGVSGFFVSNAVYAAIYPYFITSVMLRNRALPNSKPGVDIFYYQRYLVEHMAANLARELAPLLQSVNAGPGLKKKLNKVATYKPVQMARQLFSLDVYGDWKSLDGIATSPSTIIFFDEYFESIIKQINMIIDLRDKPLSQRKLSELPVALLAPYVPVLPDSMTQFVMSDTYKKCIQVIFDKQLENPLHSTRDALLYIHKLQQFKKNRARVIIYDRKALERALNKESLEQSYLGSGKPVVNAPVLVTVPVAVDPVSEKKEIKAVVSEMVPLSETQPIVNVDEEKQEISNSSLPSQLGLFATINVDKVEKKESVKEVEQELKKSKSLVTFIIEDYEPGVRLRGVK